MLSKREVAARVFHTQASSWMEVSRIMDGLVSPLRLVLAFDNRFI